MQIYSADNGIPDFLQFLSTKKKDYREWGFLNVKILSGGSQFKIDELSQSISHYFQNKEAAQLIFENDNELLLTTPNKDNLALPLFEKSIYEVFSRENVRVTDGVLHEQGLQHFFKIMWPRIKDEDNASYIGLKRASKLVNCIMVVDDDPMVLRQMEHALSGFGIVVTVSTPGEFFELYKKHAPNIVFMDIHMPGARGTNMLEELLRDHDPHAHVVMISSDTMTETVLESKAKGTKGFIMKPLTRENLYAHIMRVPTYMPKPAVS